MWGELLTNDQRAVGFGSSQMELKEASIMWRGVGGGGVGVTAGGQTINIDAFHFMNCLHKSLINSHI